MIRQVEAACKRALFLLGIISTSFLINGVWSFKSHASDEADSQKKDASQKYCKVLTYKCLNPNHKLFRKIRQANIRWSKEGELPEPPLTTQVISAQSPYSCFGAYKPLPNPCGKNSYEARNPQCFSYSLLKRRINHCTNIEYAFEVALLPQFYHTSSSWQTMYAPSLNYELFNDPVDGALSLQVGYTLIRYWNHSALTLGNRAGVAGGFNAYPKKTSILNQLTLSHVCPNNRLSFIVGQYSLYDIDGSAFTNDQLTGFISYALSRNGSATYSSGSVGAYTQVEINSELMMQAGFQDAFNVDGAGLNILNLSKNKYNTFFYTQWTPTNCYGRALYSFLLYNTREVPEQPATTTGWSLNFLKHICPKLTCFGRFNGANGNIRPIKRSITFGFVGEDLIKTRSNIIGLAGAINAISAKGSGVTDTVTNPMRSYETVIEAFGTCKFGPYLSVSPDIQFYFHPAKIPSKNTAFCLGLRTNLLL